MTSWRNSRCLETNQLEKGLAPLCLETLQARSASPPPPRLQGTALAHALAEPGARYQCQALHPHHAARVAVPALRHLLPRPRTLQGGPARKRARAPPLPRPSLSRERNGPRCPHIGSAPQWKITPPPSLSTGQPRDNHGTTTGQPTGQPRDNPRDNRGTTAGQPRDNRGHGSDNDTTRRDTTRRHGTLSLAEP